MLAATACVAPSLEILDTRILRRDPATGVPRRVVDTISDNAANAGIVLGSERHPPESVDLRWVGVIVTRNGKVEETGLGAGVLDDPANGVIWLADRLARSGQRIQAGDIVLTGSFIRMIEAPPGSRFHADFRPVRVRRPGLRLECRDVASPCQTLGTRCAAGRREERPTPAPADGRTPHFPDGGNSSSRKEEAWRLARIGGGTALRVRERPDASALWHMPSDLRETGSGASPAFVACIRAGGGEADSSVSAFRSERRVPMTDTTASVTGRAVEMQPGTATPKGYMPGFGNDFETEALPGALPLGRNSPRRCAYGLYAEQLSGSPFTAPHGTLERSWLYRIRPSVRHVSRFRSIDMPYWKTAPHVIPDVTSLGQYRWDPAPFPIEPLTFVSGMRTMTTAGDVGVQVGMAAHVYLANRSMGDEFFYSADSEILVVPQHGRIEIATEFGRIDLEPLEVCVLPRGMVFKVDLVDEAARGFVCENYGAKFTLPGRGPIGANCLANPRDFKTPCARFEDSDAACGVTIKWCDGFHRTEIDHSPLDVVAWHGNYAPYKYDLRTLCRRRLHHLRPSRSLHLHRADRADRGERHCEHRLRDLSAALGRAGANLPSALVSQEHHVGADGQHLRAVRRKANGICAGGHQPAQLHAAARAGQ